jgi:sulfonate transport system substrate-binding protein
MKTRLIGAGAVAGVALLVVLVVLNNREEPQAPSVSTPDLSVHPIYSKYDFSKEANVIDVGVQPLLPTGTVTEAMKRDAVLREALAEKGMEIRLHHFLKGADVNFFLRRGDLEVGIGGDMPAITAAAEFKALVVGMIQQGFCAIVATKHMLMEELRGKRVGCAFGSNAHYALLNALSFAGLQESDVRLVSLDVNEMPDALAQGRIDAFCAWEPTPSIALTRFEDQVVIHRSLSSGYLYFSPSFAEEHPEALRLIVASQFRAMRWLWRAPENLADASRWTLEAGQNLSGQAPVLSAKQYGRLARTDMLGLSPMPTIPKKDLAPEGRLALEFEFLKNSGNVSSTARWDEVRSCFDRTILREVISAPREYRLATYQYRAEGGSEP